MFETGKPGKPVECEFCGLTSDDPNCHHFLGPDFSKGKIIPFGSGLRLEDPFDMGNVYSGIARGELVERG